MELQNELGLFIFPLCNTWPNCSLFPPNSNLLISSNYLLDYVILLIVNVVFYFFKTFNAFGMYSMFVRLIYITIKLFVHLSMWLTILLILFQYLWHIFWCRLFFIILPVYSLNWLETNFDDAIKGKSKGSAIVITHR